MKKRLIFSLSLFVSLWPLALMSYEDVPQARPGIYGSLKNLKCPIQILPGHAFGPIELDRNLKELEDLGMPIKNVQNSKNFFIVGEFSIGLDDQSKIISIEAEIGDLPNCLVFKKLKLNKKMSVIKLSKIFDGCGKSETLIGGNIIKCKGLTINTGGWGGQQKTPSLRIISN